ncbi:hypothetical protein RJ639_045483 [Escallonia herrerae]|uniref:Uncharacterized protein n=1 Tax=Escallonia herrerae TaxID=1293975 RepID=A0AA88W6Z7_9ASTE|nr:hypothetical protein RJ639_045483 [Escallonia herrerae]
MRLIRTKDDLKNVKTPHDDPLVIIIKAEKFDVKRVLVDNGSSAEVLFYDAFKKMNIPMDRLRKMDTPLYGFSNHPVTVEGVIALPVELMGKHQYVSCCQYQPIDGRPPGVPPNTITKLIKLDGLVRIYRRPVHVSELMREFPKHMVCPSDSFYIGQRIPALSEQDQLELGRNYFLLPKHLCESALSIVTIASWSSSSGNPSISDTNKISTAALIRKKKKKAASSLSPCQQAVKQPFDIQKTASGCLRIRVSEEFIISQLIMEMEEKEDEEELKSKRSSANISLCTTEQLKKDYSQLVGWSRQRQWKPKLEMIRESTRETKSQRPKRAVPAVLLLSSSFKGSTTSIKRLIVRKKKKKRKKSQSSKKNHASFEPQHLQLHQVVSSSSSSSSSSVKKDRTKRLSTSSGTSTRLDKKERHH